MGDSAGQLMGANRFALGKGVFSVGGGAKGEVQAKRK